MNLLEETKDFMEEHGINPCYVLFCRTKHKVFPWSVFEACADFEYDDGYGSAEVDTTLEIHGFYDRVIGTGWVMYRHEYDGSEWWEIISNDTRGLEKVDTIDLKMQGYESEN